MGAVRGRLHGFFAADIANMLIAGADFSVILFPTWRAGRLRESANAERDYGGGEVPWYLRIEFAKGRTFSVEWSVSTTKVKTATPPSLI
jgi:hypothetical protein